MHVRLTPQLNRTLLHRQHLLERTTDAAHEMVEHLVGLQAQENLPPYLSLAARLDDFDPHAVTRGLEDRSLVRLLVMRGTIHLLTADDALTLRPVDPARARSASARSARTHGAALTSTPARSNAAISDAAARRPAAA